MLKQTFGIDGVPNAANAEPDEKHRFAFSPENLKIVAATIEVLSGLEVEDLLQPQRPRTIATALWALEVLRGTAGLMVDDAGRQIAASLEGLVTQLRATAEAWNQIVLEGDGEESKAAKAAAKLMTEQTGPGGVRKASKKRKAAD
jgi:hypothetical protein